MSAMAVDLKDASTTPTTRLCDDWEGDNDPWNARNWPKHRKVLSTIIICIIGFVTTMGASIYAPGHDQVKQAFGVSTTVSILPLSFYSLGLAFGPTISSPLSETFGRKTVYLLTLPLFDIFVIGSGFHKASALLQCVASSQECSQRQASASHLLRLQITPCLPNGLFLTFATTRSLLLEALLAHLLAGLLWKAKAGDGHSGPYYSSLQRRIPQPSTFESLTSLLCSSRKLSVWGFKALPGRKRSLGETVKAFLTSTILRPMHMITTEPLVRLIVLVHGLPIRIDVWLCCGITIHLFDSLSLQHQCTRTFIPGLADRSYRCTLRLVRGRSIDIPTTICPPEIRSRSSRTQYQPPSRRKTAGRYVRLPSPPGWASLVRLVSSSISALDMSHHSSSYWNVRQHLNLCTMQLLPA